LKVYLDNAATTQLDEDVIDYMHQLMLNNFGNPSSIHASGREAKVLVEQARNKIASILKVSPAEIFFTSGGTESINTIVSGVLLSSEISKVISSPIEHAAMLKSLEYNCKANDVELFMLDVDEAGQINLIELEEEISKTKGKVLVSLMHTNNEIGTLLPLNDVSDICRKFNALFLSDTVQSMGKLPVDLSDGILDFAIGSAHKFHGPKGVGFMYINGENKILPLLQGGSQERNMRAGTENTISIAAMAKAFEIAIASMQENTEKLIELKNYLIHRIESELPEITFNGHIHGLPNLINIGIPKTDNNEMLLMKFDINGIFVSGGSACSSGALMDSHVIKAIGKNNIIRPIRLAMSKFTTKNDIDSFLEVLKKI